MAPIEHTPPEGFVTMAQAREQLGVSKPTMGRLLTRYRVQVYADPRDARFRLITVEDLERLKRPVPIHTPEGKAAA